MPPDQIGRRRAAAAVMVAAVLAIVYNRAIWPKYVDVAIIVQAIWFLAVAAYLSTRYRKAHSTDPGGGDRTLLLLAGVMTTLAIGGLALWSVFFFD